MQGVPDKVAWDVPLKNESARADALIFIIDALDKIHLE
jgi:hypothetical protein